MIMLSSAPMKRRNTPTERYRQGRVGKRIFDIYCNLNGQPSASIVLNQTLGSNATDVIKRIKAKLEELKVDFPLGMDYNINYDVSKFLGASIEQVIHTLRDAFILVAIVVFVFLGDWRSTLIPTLAVPVSLTGAFFSCSFSAFPSTWLPYLPLCWQLVL